MRVIQSIIIHDVIGRPKIVLDQLRDGLATFGFGTKMKFPDLFQQLFVPGEAELKGAHVITLLNFPPSLSEDETTTKGYLLEFLKKAEAKMLQEFLVFTTGAPCLPNFGYGKIDVKFGSDPLIFASTCLQSLTLPKNFPDKTTFSSSIKASINTTGRSFNCVWFSRRNLRSVFNWRLGRCFFFFFFFIMTLRSNQTIAIIVMLP